MNSLFTSATQRQRKWIIGLAWVLALTLRLIWPLADPPSDLSWSGGYMADEGFWVHNARNDVLFGEPVFDQWQNHIVSPLVHYPVLLLFRVIGPGFLSIRLWAAFLAIISLGLLYRITRRCDPHGWLFLILSVNSILVGYQRIAILESAVIPMTLLTMLLWLKARENTLRSHFLLDFSTGIAAAAVWLIKTTQLYFIPVVLLATFISEPSRKRAYKAMTGQLAGMGLPAILWFVFIRLPNERLLAQYNSFYMSQQGSHWMDFAANLVKQPAGLYFSAIPILFPAALIFAGNALLKGRFRLQAPVINFALVWMVSGLVFFAPMGYRPLRYYLPLLIPIVILGFRFLNRDAQLISGKIPRVLITLVMLGLVGVNLPLLIDRYFTHGSLLGIPRVAGFQTLGPVLCLLSALIFGICFVLESKPVAGFVRILTVALVISLCFQTFTGVTRLINRSYSVMDASIWLKDNLPQNSVIAGQWAPQLSLETKFRAVPLWKGFVNDKEPFRNYGITHIISWEYPLGNELELQRSWYPEQMANAEKLKAFTIKESIVSLWSLNPGKEVSLPQSQVLRTTEHQDVPDQHYPATGSHDN